VDDWETMTLWGRSQLAWLYKLLPYENGIHLRIPVIVTGISGIVTADSVLS
jgi:hypothetical protein